MLEFEKEGFKVQVSDPEMYVNNQARGRSGHMSHAMAEFAPGCMIDFNSNCSPLRCNGHAAFGWIEYRISKDAGVTYSEVRELPYAKKTFEDGIYTISVEKAVGCDDGSLIAFCLLNDAVTHLSMEPWACPTAVISKDGGNTWSEAFQVSPYCGRIYDATWHDGAVYFLEHCNDAKISAWGNKPEDVYRIYASYNRGQSFEEVCVVPFPDGMGRFYGSMLFDREGRLHVYAYNINAEREMDHAVSEDCGKTWSYAGTCHLDKGIRNPQTALLDNVFILHGRGEKERDFVLYTSTDGYTWDEGEYLEKSSSDGFCGCYYSNGIVLQDPAGGNRLLLQYSKTYEKYRVNVMHRWLKIIPKSN